MTDIRALIEELRGAARDRQHMGLNALRFTQAADALEAQEAKITAIEALVGDYQTVGWIEREGNVAFVSVAEVRRILSADAPTAPLIECPHWEPGHTTLRKGCTACEADALTELVQGDAKLLQNSDAPTEPAPEKAHEARLGRLFLCDSVAIVEGSFEPVTPKRSE